MKWLFVSAVAALSLAVTTPAWTAPGPLSGQSSRPQSAPYGQGLAQNDHQHQGKQGGGQGVRKGQTVRTNQRQQQQRQQTPKTRPVRTDQRQQLQHQQTPMTRAIRTDQRQQLRRQQTQKTRAVRANQRQRQQFQRRQTQQNRAVRTNQRQQLQHQQTQRSQRYNWGSYQPGRRPPNWNSHRNFDRGAWQGNEQAQRRYHWNSYQRPSGWYYRRWTYGMILPSFFWGRQYWIDSYWNYGLSDPPYGYVWVRYGDDALLVNVENGDILRVIYGLYD